VPEEPPNLPAVPGGAGLEELVVDGEVVDGPGPPRRAAVVVHAARVITVVARDERARRAARHAGYIPAGLVVLARRRRRGRTLALDFAHQAKAQGDHANGLLWAQQHEAALKARHDRRRERRQMAVDLLRVSPAIAAAVLVAMLVIGAALAYSRRDAADVVLPFTTAAHLVADVWALMGTLLPAAAIAGPVVILAVLHEAGRRGGDSAPKWARTAADDDVDMAIDEAAITQALRELKIPQVADYLKTGMPMAYIVPCRQEGRGTYAEIRLPNDLPALEIAKQARRERLAASLYRHTKEVWPSTGADNSHLKLWIADKGALEEGAGPYPLLAEGLTDAFKGFPFGRTLRGDPSRIPVIGRNTICGGMPEQGKSNGARVVACGYTLDIITELRIYVPDTNFDFEHFAPRCSSYVMGAEDEYIEQISGELESLKDELQRRGQLLVDYEVQEVTREIAHAGVGLHPVFVLLEEAHVAIQHRKFGKDVSQLLCDIVKLDRKRGVHMFVSTQAPTKDNMPRDVTRNCANGIAFAVGDHVANDGLLGQGAYRAGHRATELIPGTDRGTAVCKGFSGERSELVQVHRIQASSDGGQVTPIVNRALAAMAAKGRALPGAERGPLAIVSRDLLADLSAVLAHRSGKVRVSELPDLLHNLAPSWGPYRGLKGVQLRTQLLTLGVPTTNPGNVPTLDLDDLAAAIRKREDEVS
jgi:S-DNA-T family DNA segregation ATPase FtsK/SpoIIIE